MSSQSSQQQPNTAAQKGILSASSTESSPAPRSSSSPPKTDSTTTKKIKKPHLKIDNMPASTPSPSPMVGPADFAKGGLTAPSETSILLTDKSSGERVPRQHHRHPSVHAHFLVNDVVGHMGARSRSGSASERELMSPAGDTENRSLSADGGPAARAAAAARVGGPTVISTKDDVQGKPVEERKKKKDAGEEKIAAAATATEKEIETRTVAPADKINAAAAAPAAAAAADHRRPSIPSSTTAAASTGTTTATALATTSNTPIAAAPATASSTGNGKPLSNTVTAGDPRLPQNDGKLHVLLGATGSISTGKLRAIINKLQDIYGKDKINIQLILTKAAEKFVSRGEIPTNIRIWYDQDEWSNWRNRSDPVVHIELRRWADILVIAPLSANTLGKIALGLCDNLLTNVVRAWNTQYPILIAPAMSNYAYNHPATKRHLKIIKEDMKWIDILRPVEKVVGSYGDIGMGGMMDWNEIVDRIVMKLGGYPEVEDDEEDVSRIEGQDDEDENGDGDDDDDQDDEEDDNVVEDDDDDDDDDGEQEENNEGDKRKIKGHVRRSQSESYN